MQKKPTKPKIPRRPLLVAGGALTLEAARLGTAVGFGSCGAPSTGGARVTLTTRARSDISDNPIVETSLGWRIEVTHGELSLDHLYYVSGPPAGLARRSNGLFSTPSAHAHPGHYDSGDVLGELQGPVSVDLLAGETTLGEGGGVTGVARSGIVTFGSLHGGDDALAIVIEGVAAQGDAVIPFRAEVERSAIDHPTSHLPEIDGCPLDDGEIAGDGTVLLEVKVAVWLDRIDFAEVNVPESGLAALEPDTPPHNAFRRGIAKAIGYQLGFSPESA
ncbi:MAG TPA: hypothetical protein VI197_32785 [Polyangiaceae bacterium]